MPSSWCVQTFVVKYCCSVQLFDRTVGHHQRFFFFCFNHFIVCFNVNNFFFKCVLYCIMCICVYVCYMCYLSISDFFFFQVNEVTHTNSMKNQPIILKEIIEMIRRLSELSIMTSLPLGLMRLVRFLKYISFFFPLREMISFFFFF